jgi:polyhydroxyalkanoate synthesis regulator phasin
MSGGGPRSGDDVTVLVLAQIIAQQERKQGGFLPQHLLAGWVQAGGETLSSLRRSMAAQFDILRQVDEEIERRLLRLISLGRLTEDEGIRLRDLLLTRGQETLQAIHPPDQMLESFRSRYGIPSRSDLRALSAQIDALTQQIDALQSKTPQDS